MLFMFGQGALTQMPEVITNHSPLSRYYLTNFKEIPLLVWSGKYIWFGLTLSVPVSASSLLDKKLTYQHSHMLRQYTDTATHAVRSRIYVAGLFIS